MIDDNGYAKWAASRKVWYADTLLRMEGNGLTHKNAVARAAQSAGLIDTDQINFTASMGQKLAAHFNVAVTDLPRVLNNHLLRVDLTYPARLNADGKVRFDWWGAGHATGEEGYYIPVNPLKESQDLSAFPWPDPRDPYLLNEAAHTLKTHGDEYFIAPNFGFALFERAWSLRGFEQIFIDRARSGICRRAAGSDYGDPAGLDSALHRSRRGWRLLRR
jgi:hypothetical protein